MNYNIRTLDQLPNIEASKYTEPNRICYNVYDDKNKKVGIITFDILLGQVETFNGKEGIHPIPKTLNILSDIIKDDLGFGIT